MTYQYMSYFCLYNHFHRRNSKCHPCSYNSPSVEQDYKDQAHIHQYLPVHINSQH